MDAVRGAVQRDASRECSPVPPFYAPLSAPPLAPSLMLAACGRARAAGSLRPWTRGVRHERSSLSARRSMCLCFSRTPAAQTPQFPASAAQTTHIPSMGVSRGLYDGCGQRAVLWVWTEGCTLHNPLLTSVTSHAHTPENACSQGHTPENAGELRVAATPARLTAVPSPPAGAAGAGTVDELAGGGRRGRPAAHVSRPRVLVKSSAGSEAIEFGGFITCQWLWISVYGSVEAQ